MERVLYYDPRPSLVPPGPQKTEEQSAQERKEREEREEREQRARQIISESHMVKWGLGTDSYIIKTREEANQILEVYTSLRQRADDNRDGVQDPFGAQAAQTESS